MIKQLVVGLALTALLPLASPSLQAQTVLVDSIVAIVEDDVVMASELRARLALVTSNLEAQGQEVPPQETLVRETLDRLILENIQLQNGQRAGGCSGEAGGELRDHQDRAEDHHQDSAGLTDGLFTQTDQMACRDDAKAKGHKREAHATCQRDRAVAATL